MMQDLIHVSGLKELDRKLGLLPINIRTNVLRRALRAGGKVMGLAARRLAPEIWVKSEPTRLRRKSNITWRVSRIRGDRARVKVSWVTHRKRGNKFEVPFPWYAHWVEFGIPSRGIKAEPFLGPAFDQSSDDALKAYARVMGEGIEEETRKLK
jgi:HK97 gp10 family phage protein